jgi:hypothetical protein
VLSTEEKVAMLNERLLEVGLVPPGEAQMIAGPPDENTDPLLALRDAFPDTPLAFVGMPLSASTTRTPTHSLGANR